MTPSPFLLLLQVIAVCYQLNRCKGVLTSVFSHLAMKVLNVSSVVFYSNLPAGKKGEKLWLQRLAVSCAMHLQRLLDPALGTLSCTWLLSTAYTLLLFLILLWVHEMNERLRSVSNSVSPQVALLKIDRRSYFIF